MKRVIMLNTKELPVSGTLYFQACKFISSFSFHGYELLEVRTIEDFLNLNPTKFDIVYLSNHGPSTNILSAQKCFEKFKSLQCTFILWFYHDYIKNLQMPKKWILTGEHFRKEPKLEGHHNSWIFQKTLQNYVPMTFATSILPNDIGKFQRNEILKASFVGAPYQVSWCKSLVSLDNNILIKYTPPFISEEERYKIYLSSVVSLGFHSENNSKNSVLVERIFEGLALGNVVISENPACEEFTDGNVKFVSSFEEVKEEIEKAWNNPYERRLRQESGMKWCKEHGTYVNVSKSFIEKSNELWGIK